MSFVIDTCKWMWLLIVGWMCPWSWDWCFIARNRKIYSSKPRRRWIATALCELKKMLTTALIIITFSDNVIPFLGTGKLFDVFCTQVSTRCNFCLHYNVIITSYGSSINHCTKASSITPGISVICSPNTQCVATEGNSGICHYSVLAL